MTILLFASYFFTLDTQFEKACFSLSVFIVSTIKWKIIFEKIQVEIFRKIEKEKKMPFHTKKNESIEKKSFIL